MKSPRRSLTNLQHIISTFGKPTIIMLASAHLQSELVLGIVSNHNKKAKLKVQIKLTSRKLSRCDSTTSCLRSKHFWDGVTSFRSSTRSSMMRWSYHISTTIGPGMRQVLIGFWLCHRIGLLSFERQHQVSFWLLLLWFYVWPVPEGLGLSWVSGHNGILRILESALWVTGASSPSQVYIFKT